MKRTYRCGALLTVVVSLLLVGRGALAEAGKPQDVVRGYLQRLSAVLTDETLRVPEQRQARRERIHQVVSESFDFEEMARRSLGHHWHRLSSSQQEEFVQIFGALLQQSLVGRIAYRAKTPMEGYGSIPDAIHYVQEHIDPDGYASVQTEMTYKLDEATETIEYLLLKHDGTWQVYDVITEGASMLTNYRTEFAKIIRQESYDDLIKRLKMSQP